MAKFTLADYAKQHGLDVQTVVAEKNNWLYAEGYDDSGTEYSLIEWLDTFCAHKTSPKNYQHHDNTPYQKGDEYGL